MTQSFLVATILLLGCYLAADAQTNDCAAIASATHIAEVGAFSNIRYTEEHAYGYRVMLWRAGTCLVGFFESSAGLAGDTPIGWLQDVKYNQKTAALSFSAKLTTGLVSSNGSGAFQPSQDVFTFEGQMKPKRVTGAVTHASQNTPTVKPVRQMVHLPSSKKDAEFMHGPVTYGEWREQWRPVLQRRGPKW
jgi:hypothetical protein